MSRKHFSQANERTKLIMAQKRAETDSPFGPCDAWGQLVWLQYCLNNAKLDVRPEDIATPVTDEIARLEAAGDKVGAAAVRRLDSSRIAIQYERAALAMKVRFDAVRDKPTEEEIAEQRRAAEAERQREAEVEARALAIYQRDEAERLNRAREQARIEVEREQTSAAPTAPAPVPTTPIEPEATARGRTGKSRSAKGAA